MQRCFALALIFLWAVPARTSGQTQSAPAAPPIELLISGPRLIHYGQELAFTIAPVNRSAAPVAISKRQNGTIYPTFSWKMLDPDGMEPPPPHVEKRNMRVVCPLSSPLSDNDLVILKPGEKFVFTRDGDFSIRSRERACIASLCTTALIRGSSGILGDHSFFQA